MMKQHKNYAVSNCGTSISKENPWLLATPDFMSVFTAVEKDFER